MHCGSPTASLRFCPTVLDEYHLWGWPRGAVGSSLEALTRERVAGVGRSRASTGKGDSWASHPWLSSPVSGQSHDQPQNTPTSPLPSSRSSQKEILFFFLFPQKISFLFNLLIYFGLRGVLVTAGRIFIAACRFPSRYGTWAPELTGSVVLAWGDQ